MKKNNLIRFAQSLVFLPIMAIGINQTVLVQKLNSVTNGTLALNQATLPAVDPKIQLLAAEADAIDTYFKLHDMPLAGLGMKMVEEANNNGLDWRLLPAIAVRESTGGKNACDTVAHNPFGWGSCKIGFKSYEEAIEIVAKNLGGNNPSTALHYDNKTTKQILHAYNPPSIIPRYAEQVMAIMNSISTLGITPNTPASSSDLLAQKV
ncbi:MAG TPA: hypothetical protein VGO21_00525 [Candidatus Paceibacterota bacterium]|nr:hypothetical protein [Candidatus Paceibacterota bacterium]